MSLVNDLLEDFYRRRVPQDDNPESPLAGIEVPPRRLVPDDGAPSRAERSPQTSVVPWLVAFSCVAVITIEIFVRLAPTGEANTKPDVSARPPFVLSEVAPRAEAFDRDTVSPGVAPIGSPDSFAAEQSSTGDPAELTGLDVESADGYTRLRFHLSRERDYWIQGDPADGEIEIVITGTRLSDAFSPFSFGGSGLNLREAHNSSIGLHLLLSLEPSSRIQSQFVNDGFRSQLVLDVISASATSLVVTEIADSSSQQEVSSQQTTEASRRVSWGRIRQTKPSVAEAIPEAYKSLDRARDLTARKRPAEAIAEYLRAITMDPDLHRAREGLVALLLESGQLDAAQRHLSAGIARDPSYSEYTLLQAQVLVAKKQPDRAIAILESLPTPPKRRSDALNLLAALYQQKGRHPRAETLFRRAVQIAPHKARLWMGLGISLEGQQRRTEALAVYKQAESLADFETGPRRWLRSRIRSLSTVE